MTTLDFRQFVQHHRYRVAFYCVAVWLSAIIFANPVAVRDGGITVFENIQQVLLYTRDGTDAESTWPMEKLLDAIESDAVETKLIALEELGRRRGSTARLALLSAVQTEVEPVMQRTAVRSLMAHRDAADQVFLSQFVAAHLAELDPVFIVAMFQIPDAWMFEAMEKILSTHPDPRARQLAFWALNHKNEIAKYAAQ